MAQQHKLVMDKTSDENLPRLNFYKNPGGRPSKYTPEIIEKAKEFLHKFQDLGLKIPTKQGLAIYLGINNDTLYSWLKDEQKKEFSDIVDHMTNVTHEMLVSGGLTNEFNPTITKLILSSKYGYHENNQSGNAQITINVSRETLQDISIDSEKLEED